MMGTNTNTPPIINVGTMISSIPITLSLPLLITPLMAFEKSPDLTQPLNLSRF